VTGAASSMNRIRSAAVSGVRRESHLSAPDTTCDACQPHRPEASVPARDSNDFHRGAESMNQLSVVSSRLSVLSRGSGAPPVSTEFNFSIFIFHF
jgi:hypothetical protein